MSTETELKLRIVPEDIPKFMQHPLLQGAVVGIAQPLHNTYFDTPDHALLQQGLGLRVRQVGDQYFQSVKTSGAGVGGLHQRQEWEMAIGGATPEYHRFPEGVLPSWCNHDLLQPLFTTNFVRNIWELVLEEGSCLEIALDQGEIKSLTRQMPLCEIELELKQGTPDRLFQVALTLQKALPLVIENKSKAERGYTLHQPRPLKFYKANPTIGLTVAMTVEQAFVKIIWHCLEHLQANEEMVLAGEDPEGVHQMRVALRRLRSVLNLYQPVIPNKTHTKIRKELKGLAALLGTARDWDVLQATLPGMSKESAWLLEILPKVANQRTQVYQGVRGTLQSPRYSRLWLMLGKWLTRRSWRLHLDSCANLEVGVKAFASEILDKHYHLVCQQGEHLEQLTAEQHHALRIQVKRLGYGVRFFAELYRDDLARSFIKALAQVQDELGILNDAEVAVKLLNQLEIEDPKGGPFLQGWYAHQRFTHLANLAKAWQSWRERPIFWQEELGHV